MKKQSLEASCVHTAAAACSEEAVRKGRGRTLLLCGAAAASLLLATIRWLASQSFASACSAQRARGGATSGPAHSCCKPAGSMADPAQAGAADDRALALVLHGSLTAPAAAGRRGTTRAREGGVVGARGGQAETRRPTTAHGTEKRQRASSPRAGGARMKGVTPARAQPRSEPARSATRTSSTMAAGSISTLATEERLLVEFHNAPVGASGSGVGLCAGRCVGYYWSPLRSAQARLMLALLLHHPADPPAPDELVLQELELSEEIANFLQGVAAIVVDGHNMLTRNGIYLLQGEHDGIPAFAMDHGFVPQDRLNTQSDPQAGGFDCSYHLFYHHPTSSWCLRGGVSHKAAVTALHTKPHATITNPIAPYSAGRKSWIHLPSTRLPSGCRSWHNGLGDRSITPQTANQGSGQLQLSLGVIGCRAEAQLMRDQLHAAMKLESATLAAAAWAQLGESAVHLSGFPEVDLVNSTNGTYAQIGMTTYRGQEWPLFRNERTGWYLYRGFTRLHEVWKLRREISPANYNNGMSGALIMACQAPDGTLPEGLQVWNVPPTCQDEFPDGFKVTVAVLR
jgi:hypothetical protein